MSPTRAQILAAINACPDGITAHSLAIRLGSTVHAISGAVSKLGMYGTIDRTALPPVHGGKAYLLKPKAVAL